MTFQIETTVGFLLSQAIQRMRRELLKQFKEYDITTEQWSLLHRLWQQDGISQTELASRTYKDLPSVTRILHKLEQKGLLVRQPSPHDSRTSLIYLTPAGREWESALNPIMASVQEKTTARLSPAEVAELKRLLLIVMENLGEE